MAELSGFTLARPRPLPVILLADASGSMSVNGKIDVMNEAIAEMIKVFAEEGDARAEIHVGAVTFGGDSANVHQPLTRASELTWLPIEAAGRTPMGGAFSIAQQLIENPEVVPSRAYRPAIVLLSDGVPTDDWESPLGSLLASKRAAKADRFAVAIGEEADMRTLSAFVDDSIGRVFEAHEVRQIRQFLRWVTMSVTSRSRSANPNSDITDLLNFEDFDF
jgi:uncharacterized protein YegL